MTLADRHLQRLAAPVLAGEARRALVGEEDRISDVITEADVWGYLRLRPEGRQGALVRSLSAFREYYERWVSVWEVQALLRAAERDFRRLFSIHAGEQDDGPVRRSAVGLNHRPGDADPRVRAVRRFPR